MPLNFFFEIFKWKRTSSGKPKTERTLIDIQNKTKQNKTQNKPQEKKLKLKLKHLLIMPEVSQLTFEDSSWEEISQYEVQTLPAQQKFGKTFGVGRKVTNGKTFYTAKLPAKSSATGKTIKLGLFPTCDEASAAVQYALQNPGK